MRCSCAVSAGGGEAEHGGGLGHAARVGDGAEHAKVT
jgi:hypothetical protein